MSALDEVLEEVGAERELGNVVALLAGDLHEHGRVADVGVGHVDAELDVAAAAPAAGPHQDELPLGQQLVQLCPPPCPTLRRSRRSSSSRVAVRVDVDDVGDVGDAAVRDAAVRGEQDDLAGQVARDRSRRELLGVALGAALEQIEILAVGGELDVHGTVELSRAAASAIASICLTKGVSVIRPSKVTTTSSCVEVGLEARWACGSGPPRRWRRSAGSPG